VYSSRTPNGPGVRSDRASLQTALYPGRHARERLSALRGGWDCNPPVAAIPLTPPVCMHGDAHSNVAVNTDTCCCLREPGAEPKHWRLPLTPMPPDPTKGATTSVLAPSCALSTSKTLHNSTARRARKLVLFCRPRCPLPPNQGCGCLGCLCGCGWYMVVVSNLYTNPAQHPHAANLHLCTLHRQVTSGCATTGAVFPQHTKSAASYTQRNLCRPATRTKKASCNQATQP
jgi:hypothetical protein